MYEMEGPRPASRHRPADFSASFVPLDHLPGPGTRPVVQSRPDHRWLGISPVPWLKAFLFANEPGFPPSQVAPSISSAGGAELSCCQTTGVSPKPNGARFSLCRVAQSFLRITQLGVSPPPLKLKFSLCRVVPGFPRGQMALKSAQYRWCRASPGPEASDHAHYQVVWGFPRTGGTRLSPGPEALESA
jgi:hypothetical protein